MSLAQMTEITVNGHGNTAGEMLEGEALAKLGRVIEKRKAAKQLARD